MNTCKICLRKSNAKICRICGTYCRDILYNREDILPYSKEDILPVLYKCVLCLKIKTPDMIFRIKVCKNVVCKYCYKIYYNQAIKWDNTCMICLQSDLTSTIDHVFYMHNMKIQVIPCKYCNKKDVLYKNTKDYYYKHHCVIPIKNKYMNINIL